MQSRIMAQEEFLGLPPSRPVKAADMRCHFRRCRDMVEVLGLCGGDDKEADDVERGMLLGTKGR